MDEALVVMSLVEPDFSESLLDYYLVNAEQYGVKCQIILSKYDLFALARILLESYNR